MWITFGGVSGFGSVSVPLADVVGVTRPVNYSQTPAAVVTMRGGTQYSVTEGADPYARIVERMANAGVTFVG